MRRHSEWMVPMTLPSGACPQRLPETLTEFLTCGFRERDRHDLTPGNAALPQMEVATGEHPRLAGAGTRADDGISLGGDGPLLGWGRARHAAPR